MNLVPEDSCKLFKIAPTQTASADDWLLSPLAALSFQDARNAEGDVAYIVAVAADEESAASLEKSALAQAQDGAHFESKRKSERILFCGKSILLQCASAELESKLQALKLFCRLLSSTESLEKRVKLMLDEAKKDASFTGRVGPDELLQFDRLDERNKLATLARIEFAEIERDVLLAKQSRNSAKVIEELLESSGLEDRLEQLDDEVEIAEEVYAVCIDRLSEFSYFWREFKAELWIILILVLELVAFFWDLAVQMKWVVIPG
ncbi:MAG: hypothetical protein K2X81_13670 [Candidatus Obscuribacterales bacterium]|nr:hypothetical protein [Candidatus Obscuribacterales bacterium]